MSISELVHNALEHSRGDLITIDIQRTERELVCVVHDNGAGMLGEPGLGLSIVGDLVVKELRGEFEFLSSDEPGTSAAISIPLARSVQVLG
jgi:two-component sensor histidine kinase